VTACEEEWKKRRDTPVLRHAVFVAIEEKRNNG
jgi:hypothetical protein